jgi:TrmH family RNA methyltransferase
VKASMGTVFAASVVPDTKLDEAFAWCRSGQVQVVTTSARAQAEHWDVALQSPAAIVLGSERHGLPQEVLARGDVQVRIPMWGSASSLNLAIAAGILLYEARRPSR